MSISRLSTLVLAACSLLFSLSVTAASSKRIERSIDASDLTHIDFEISVAEIDIQVYDGDIIELDIYLREDRGWWPFGRADIDDIDLQVERGSTSLDLRLDEDDIQQDWRVRLPAHLAVSMEVGVGEIDLDGLENDLLMELGVGSLQVNVADIDFESVRVSTGVGDSSLRGFGDDTDNERNFVGADSHYFGDGEFEIDVEVGVGEARVIRR
ncbi:MAG: hypothetical protein MI746_18245 [Pseudomonadales bacterium]|nr:hypothetical protein [Pseudomonadales bacterium]